MRPTDFDQLTHLIYAGAVDDASFQLALESLASQFGCNSSAFVYIDLLRPMADIQLTHGPFSSPDVRARYMTFAHEDPAPAAMARLALGEATSTQRLFSAEFHASSRFVNEFYRPLGFEESLGGPVANSDGRTGILAVHRGRDRETFDDDEIASFGRLLQHFAHALVLRRRFFQTSEQRRLLAETLEPAANGIMIFGPDGVLTHANAKAREILARNDGFLMTRSGHLRVSEPEADRRLRGLATSNGVAKTAFIRPIPRGGDRRPYLARVKPTTSAGLQGYTVYVSDPESISTRAVESIEAAFGLSRQSATLVATLSTGGDLAGYATMMGVSRNTAKFHLQSAFAATGTARQADLVREVTRALRDLGVMDQA